MEFLFPALIFGLMYFLLIRPQQQRARAQRALVSQLSVGDEVVTIGGLYGRIVDLDGDTVSLEASPGVVLRFRRVAVSALARPDSEPEADPAEPRDDGAG